MEINVNKKEQAAVDDAMRYFLSVHKNGIHQDTQDVCGAVRRALKGKGCNVPDEYVEARWHQFLEEENVTYDAEEKVSIARSKHEKAMEWWNLAKPHAEKYLNELSKKSPLPPKLDVGLVNDVLKSDKDETVKALNCSELAVKFAYAGRAFEFDLSNTQRAGIRRLEDRGIVKMMQFETTIKLEKKGKKTEYRPYTVFYWEPTGKAPEKERKEKESYDCYFDNDVWDRADSDKT